MAENLPCECATRTPTYPEFRDRPHLPDCIYDRIQRLEEAGGPTPDTERLRSTELEALMDRVQELLEANVLAMVIRHPSGHVSVTCLPSRRAEVGAILRGYDWSAFDRPKLR